MTFLSILTICFLIVWSIVGIVLFTDVTNTQGPFNLPPSKPKALLLVFASGPICWIVTAFGLVIVFYEKVKPVIEDWFYE